jgi:hypothetical protein
LTIYFSTEPVSEPLETDLIILLMHLLSCALSLGLVNDLCRVIGETPFPGEEV